jgi:hypothetical protein
MPSNFIAKGADGYEAIMGRWSRSYLCAQSAEQQTVHDV